MTKRCRVWLTVACAVSVFGDLGLDSLGLVQPGAVCSKSEPRQHEQEAAGVIAVAGNVCPLRAAAGHSAEGWCAGRERCSAV